jgi:hypothetical protein
MADLSTLNVIALPADFTAAEIADIKAANPGSGFIQILPASKTVAATAPIAATPQALSLWGQLAEGILGAGATLLVPGPWLPIVSLVVNEGVPWVEGLLAGNPTVEKWTVEMLQAQRAALPVPLT